MKEFMNTGMAIVATIAIMGMVMACEPGAGTDGTGTTTEGTTDEGTTDEGTVDEGTDEGTTDEGTDEGTVDEGTDEGTTDEGITTCTSDEECSEGETCDMETETCSGGGADEGTTDDSFPIIEISDDPNNSTLKDCDKGTLKSPGADIDAAELVEGEDIIATLSSCTLNEPGDCESTASDAATAEGAPDGTGKEETGTYVALNGGRLRCEWSDGAQVTSGQVITVYEIGGSGGTKVEQYTIRMCRADGEEDAGICSEDSTYASGKVEFETDSFF